MDVTTENFRSRIKSSCYGISTGLLLFFGSIGFLFWNEGRAVDRYDTLEEGQLQTVSISSPVYDPNNDNRLIHFTAEISSPGANLTDPVFDIVSTDLKLQRATEMYQWEESKTTEERNKVGGGTETITRYSYQKTWSSSLIDSSSFRESRNHENPSFFPFEGLILQQENIKTGEFFLPGEVINKINWYQPLFVSETESVSGANLLNNRQGYFISANGLTSESSPAVGDSRVKFSTVEPRTISVVAEQKGNTIARWQARESDGSILLFKQGNFTADEMFLQAEAENQTTTWLYRLLGFLLMALGISLVLNPIKVFADVIPLLGDIVGAGICVVAVILAMFFSGLTISIAWLVNHPMIGGLILLGFVVVTGGLYYYFKQRKDAAGDGNNETTPGKLEPANEADVEVGGKIEEEPDIPIVEAEPDIEVGGKVEPYVPVATPYVPKAAEEEAPFSMALDK